MASVGMNDLKNGMKVEIDKDPYVVVGLDFVKPGKGQAFTRAKIKNLLTSRVVEKTFKSNDKIDLADVEESKMRLLYVENDGAVFMDDESFEQITVGFDVLGDKKQWLMEEQLYSMTFFKGNIIDVTPPIFLEMTIAETAPGLRGDTSGRALKPAVLETGAKIQIPLFVDEGEKIKVDTRTGEYVSRV